MTIDARHPLPGTRPLVVGGARSGLSAARLLALLGLDVRLCDARPAAELTPAVLELANLGVDLWLGVEDVSLLDRRDFVVWSPGIPDTHPLAAAARERGIPVRSELELGFLAAHARMVCVTGTNGKSTTTDLIGTLLRAAGREVEVCGNIGLPICDVAERVSPSGLLVVEVSSFQLETVERLQPFVAVWLNLTPDHLDRHGDLDTYGALKQRLFARQGPEDYAVWNADDPEVMARRAGAGTPLLFSANGPVAEGAYLEDGHIRLAWRGGTESLMAASDLGIPGPHNRLNALAALAATLPLEIPPPLLRETLRGYPGLEHRLEPVATIQGVKFVNDSKATNAGSLEVALRSFDAPVVLIAGGRDKGQDFTPLAPLVKQQVQRLVLIGEGAARMEQAWKGVPATHAETLPAAVSIAFAEARGQGGGVVLLSPGCASFDMFQDFEDRGRRFKEAVAGLEPREAHA